MQQVLIPHDQWQDFCELFSRQHYGWVLTVGLVDNHLVDRPLFQQEQEQRILFRDMVLRGITLEHQFDQNQILIVLEDEGRRIVHRVTAPTQIIFEQTPQGEHQGTQIQTSSGHTILLRFRTAALPESLDGFIHSEYE